MTREQKELFLAERYEWQRWYCRKCGLNLEKETPWPPCRVCKKWMSAWFKVYFRIHGEYPHS